MDFGYSAKVQELRRQVRQFLDDYIVPRLAEYNASVKRGEYPPAFMSDLKALAKYDGLWNLFLPGLKDDEPGTRLTNLEYAPLAEIMGRVPWAAEVFNCSAPDSGNMELLHMFGSEAQKQEWLTPLLEGDIRSAFCMSEPDVSSSDATNITMHIQRKGDEYLINGRKWFISNAAHPKCQLYIVMGKTDLNASAHRQQSMVLVPANSEGITVVRNPTVLNHHSPDGHCEITFKNVRVPVTNILGTEGAGFELAQARLGPGRIHHCMRSIGAAELALELMAARSLERRAFGKYLHQHGAVSDAIARSRIEIDQARLLVLKTAWLIDTQGIKAALKEVAMIKALVPSIQTSVTDRAIQVFGAMGLTPDTPLADSYISGRCLRLADGPDEVHLQSVAKLEVQQSSDRLHEIISYLTPPLD